MIPVTVVIPFLIPYFPIFLSPLGANDLQFLVFTALSFVCPSRVLYRQKMRRRRRY
ncbi:hypothetical protein F4810DRAFT_677978 [Camillea tinctor]|nr:hypothetical protein F4810DRAFT_677978 [Camillea tinctor]